MDLNVLKAEVETAPYAGLDQTAISVALNAKTIDADVDVPIVEARRPVIRAGVMGAVDARIDFYRTKVGAEVATGSANEQRLAKLYTARRALELLDDLKTSDATAKAFVGSMTSDLVSEGVMTAGQRSAVLALAAGKISRAEQLFGRGAVVTPEQVEKARRL